MLALPVIFFLRFVWCWWWWLYSLSQTNRLKLIVFFFRRFFSLRALASLYKPAIHSPPGRSTDLVPICCSRIAPLAAAIMSFCYWCCQFCVCSQDKNSIGMILWIYNRATGRGRWTAKRTVGYRSWYVPLDLSGFKCQTLTVFMMRTRTIWIRFVIIWDTLGCRTNELSFFGLSHSRAREKDCEPLIRLEANLFLSEIMFHFRTNETSFGDKVGVESF